MRSPINRALVRSLAAVAQRRVAARAAMLLLALVVAGCLKPLPPPNPNPIPPNPPPQPAAALRVVILWESGHGHTREQLNVLNSTKLVTALDTATGNDGWRKWDASSLQRTGWSDETSEWQAIAGRLKLDAVTEPQVILIRGPQLVAKPLPTTEPAAISLLQSEAKSKPKSKRR